MKPIFRRLALAAGLAWALPVLANGGLLNVSYDVARDFYKDFNPLFREDWKTRTGKTVEIRQSHGGSSKQVRAVADGLDADVVTMNQATDINFLVEKGLVAKDYTGKFPDNASPYTSTMVFIVVFRRRLHVSLEVGCTNNAACEDGAKNHVAISQNVLPPPQVTLPRPLCAALHRLQHEQLSHRLPSSNKPGLTIFHQHFGNQRARVVVR